MKNTKQLRQTLRAARKLQRQYDELGAASTQRIRNPLPMPKLVLTVLPTHSGVAATPITLTPHARTCLSTSAVRAIDEYNATVNSVRKPEGLTVNQIVDKLASRGFFVRKQHVAQTLSNFKHNPNSLVGATQAPYEGQGRRFLYFVRS